MHIQAVCLSDLHFGAENSLLSHVDKKALVDYATPSPVLVRLVDCLRTLLASQSNSAPTLVLNGDILELALAQDNVAAMVFDRFVDLAFEEHAIFDSTVLYIPGNHDHHIWETAREHMYAEYVNTTPRETDLQTPWHATNMFVEDIHHRPEAELLSALMRRRTGTPVSVRIVYPNLGLEAPDTGRRALVHHGHFTEPLYRLLSAGKSQLFPRQPAGRRTWDWEADNFAWIDFFWSSLGRSGTAGEDVGVIYDMLQDPDAVSELAGELGAMSGKIGPRALQPFLRRVGRYMARETAKLSVGRIERMNPGELLTPSGQRGLDEYLTGPLALQLDSEHRPRSQLSFIFGHTHKPFECAKNFEGISGPVAIFNSGGWVVDREKPEPLHGASVLLIDDQCNVSALRMFNQSPRSEDYRVELRPQPLGGQSQLDRWISERFDFDAQPWSLFSQTVAAEVARRCELLPMIIKRGLQYTS